MEDKTILAIANEKLLNIDPSTTQAFIDKFNANVTTCLNGLKSALERNLHNDALWWKCKEQSRDYKVFVGSTAYCKKKKEKEKKHNRRLWEGKRGDERTYHRIWFAARSI